MADIFISYASEDRNRVRPLAEALEKRGLSVWWDRSLGAGEDYSSVIERELKAARAVIVVWTQGSAASTFVRDEAGRARDEGRLVPVMLDRVEIPLGFGSFQAEDFTRWNGGSNAPQMQLLDEALRAKLEGRSVDGEAVARKRRRLMSRIRIVSLLTVVALIIGIAAGLNNLLNKPEPVQPDLRAELLRLLAEGALTPEQAIQLAQILETGALGEAASTQVSENGGASSGSSNGPSPSPAPSDSGTVGADAPGTEPVQTASVTESEFSAAARETYQQASVQLLQHPDASVRQAVLDMSDATKRQAAMQTLWTYANSSADDATRLRIYELCGAVGESNADPLARQALEAATSLQPDDPDNWRMLSRSFRRTADNGGAAAAALVSQGVEAQSQGQTEAAEQAFSRALPNLNDAAPRAAVASRLGEIAEQRGDWSAASQRHAEAFEAREQAATETPTAVAQTTLQADASRLARALDNAGRTQEACQRLRAAQDEHQVEAEDQTLADRCRRLYRIQVRPASQLLQQRAPATETAPATTATQP